MWLLQHNFPYVFPYRKTLVKHIKQYHPTEKVLLDSSTAQINEDNKITQEDVTDNKLKTERTNDHKTIRTNYALQNHF